MRESTGYQTNIGLMMCSQFRYRTLFSQTTKNRTLITYSIRSLLIYLCSAHLVAHKASQHFSFSGAYIHVYIRRFARSLTPSGIRILGHFKLILKDCVVSQNIYTSPTKGMGFSMGEGELICLVF